jgi:hypothetical protein
MILLCYYLSLCVDLYGLFMSQEMITPPFTASTAIGLLYLISTQEKKVNRR